MNYPLHLGVTGGRTCWWQHRCRELRLLIRVSDTLRVSLTADPTEEVAVGIGILTDLGLRQGGISLVSCPTCGRCTVDMISATERVEKRLKGSRVTCAWR